ncbi:MAG: peptidoglycan bridge formation glycyltransferase FemA/FemB family protein [Patescibacteria group bacterium]
MTEHIKPEEWNAFFVQQEHPPFLQSHEWGVFQEKRGFRIMRKIYGTASGNAAVQAIRYPLIGKYGYWYAPYYPLLASEEYQQFFNDCSHADPQSIFVRFEPKKTLEQASILRTKELTPSTTLLLSLSPDISTLLNQMHPKTRYNIGLASRKGVVVQRALPHDASYQDWCQQAIKLFRSTGERQSYRVQTEDYYRLLFSSFVHGESDHMHASIHLYCAWYSDTMIGAILVVTFGGVATYLYGGSASEYREAMGAYALQWTGIQDAQSMGCHAYDFWGIADTDDSSHPWSGITRFKKGFGGIAVSRPGTFDSVTKPLQYRLYNILRRVRRTLGGAQKR